MYIICLTDEYLLPCCFSCFTRTTNIYLAEIVMNKAAFKFEINDNRRSLTYIALGLFTLGIIIGVWGSIWYNTTALESALLLPLIIGAVPPLFFIIQGIRTFSILGSKNVNHSSY